eukprot:TRINITY_DN10739_c0_g1_i1.p2 TRINITY_DN10739_c0_g1~~TRINITY_DN10739_c0_g1_i1.p2  ORF type:complete len:102 (+),score=27.24 TRINITY_DN10739_c0_g1_i1:73-378(+)
MVRRCLLLGFALCSLHNAVVAQFSEKAREHAPRVKQNFKESDANGDGLLSLAELTEARKQMGSKDPEDHAQGTINKMDTDGDSHVSLKEFFEYSHIPLDEL